jgi:hypothetical protein
MRPGTGQTVPGALRIVGTQLLGSYWSGYFLLVGLDLKIGGPGGIAFACVSCTKTS